MLALCSLQNLYLKQVDDTASPLEKLVAQYLESPSTFCSDILQECEWEEPLLSQEKVIENWKHLLAVNILCDLTKLHKLEIPAKVRLFERNPWNQNSQYFRALVALNHALAKMPIPEVGGHLLESGAALIDLHEYCPWLSLPYTPQHFEFAIFLCLLTLLTKRQDLQETVLRLAQWQLNTLDASAKPLSGLFVREKDGQNQNHLILSYLLFRSAAILSEETSFGGVADAAMKEIQKIGKEKEKIDPLWPLIEKWLEQFKALSSSPLLLSEQIYDPSTALVGYRSPSQHVVCTLHGDHTGLGVFRQGDIEIINYGPQYLPLGDCMGFGIEGNALSEKGIRRSTIDWRPHSFTLKGCARMVDQPAYSLFESGKFRGIWMEVVQEFKRPHFYLKTNFLGLDGWESVAFSFFVKATRCLTSSNHYILPRTLERYEGPVQTLTFEGDESVLELRSLSYKGKMQVLPLGGGNNFWGADFLIAYILSPDQRQYQWHIGPK